ncbi:MAG: putative N-acylneuraminate cytidylyltransferase [Parcubacteria group bacterium]|nr:putative N-acylneuraminate cytidylyltransferase [Parcubacteria group bacterium]
MNTTHPPQVRVLAIIPARGGSKGIPRKNLLRIGEIPLVGYAVRAAKAAHGVDAVIVSTDDEEIANVAREYGADVPFLRPAELAQDTSRDIEALTHTLDWVKKERGWEPEIVLLLPPTSPSRMSSDIEAVIAQMDETGADSVRTMVHPPHWNPYKMWRDAGETGAVQPILPQGALAVPRQELDRHYMPVGIAYAMRTSNIRKGSMWGEDVRVLEIPLARYTDIDTPEDVEEAERVMKEYGII